MTDLLSKILSGYNHYLHDWSDPRWNGWPLYSPVSVFAATSIYLFCTLVLGPRYMENRKPYQLKTAMTLYNAVQVMVNAYIVAKAIPYYFKFNLICAEVDYSNTPWALDQGTLVWIYYFNKYLDWLDTAFIILRKKTSQLSFLHWYHHWSTPIFVWSSVRFAAGGHTILLLNFNALVHTVLYLYYLATNLNIPVDVRLKKAITKVQLLQFMVGLLWTAALFLNPSCGYSRIVQFMALSNGTLFLFLFGNFYRFAYNRREKTKST